MMGREAACQAVALHVGLPPRQGAAAGAGGGGGDWVSGSAGSADYGPASSGPPSSSSSSSSLFSSTPSMTTDEEDDDGAMSAPPHRRHVSYSSLSSFTSSESETARMDDDGAAAAAAAGPLYELSTMLENLPALRTGLSKYYQGRSQSFTSLADVSCVDDLAKKTTPYIRRSKASRSYAAALGVKNSLSKKKKPGGSHELLLSRGKKPPAYQGKREVYRMLGHG